jgi:hypothetical protein
MIKDSIFRGFVLCVVAVRRVAFLLYEATPTLRKRITITPVSNSYIEKVIRGA